MDRGKSFLANVFGTFTVLVFNQVVLTGFIFAQIIFRIRNNYELV
jgi:membrane-bound acyltransferase YfiQ involved in biofilm formation